MEILCNNQNGKTIWKIIDTCICITESLCCTPEINTTLLINYTPISFKKFFSKTTKDLKIFNFKINFIFPDEICHEFLIKIIGRKLWLSLFWLLERFSRQQACVLNTSIQQCCIILFFWELQWLWGLWIWLKLRHNILEWRL